MQSDLMNACIQHFQQAAQLKYLCIQAGLPINNGEIAMQFPTAAPATRQQMPSVMTGIPRSQPGSSGISIPIQVGDATWQPQGIAPQVSWQALTKSSGSCQHL